MANLQEIKARIASVNSTKKITRAMYLISASKSQKAKKQLAGSAPYFSRVTATMAKIMAGADELDTPFTSSVEDGPGQDSRPTLYLVIGADKGMAGGYGHNINDYVEQLVDKEKDELWVCGLMSRSLLGHLGYRVREDFSYPVLNPNMMRAREISEQVVEAYLTGKYRCICLVFTEMITSLKQMPTKMLLLPLDPEPFHNHAPDPEKREEFHYEPSAIEVFDELVPHYLKGILYGAFVESFASEQSARMLAMDGATKSANETIDRLSIQYNRARQAKITQELTEIIGGIPASD